MSDAIPVNRIKGVGEKTAALFGKIKCLYRRRSDPPLSQGL